MSRVSRDSWKPGAVWRNKDPNPRGTLEAVIVAKTDRPNYKKVRMEYLDGRHYGPVLADYSHAHMLRYFVSTGEKQDVTQWLNCQHEKTTQWDSHCKECGGSRDGDKKNV